MSILSQSTSNGNVGRGGPNLRNGSVGLNRFIDDCGIRIVLLNGPVGFWIGFKQDTWIIFPNLRTAIVVFDGKGMILPRLLPCRRFSSSSTREATSRRPNLESVSSLSNQLDLSHSRPKASKQPSFFNHPLSRYALASTAPMSSLVHLTRRRPCNHYNDNLVCMDSVRRLCWNIL